jgi:hypothetical protein
MLEQLLRSAIREEDLDIDYSHGTATNHYGTEYSVSIDVAKDCFDLSRVSYKDRHIELKTSCDQDVDQGHFLAHNLAHELGHSEVYVGANLLWAIIGTAGILHGLKAGSGKILLGTGLTMLSYKLFIEEGIAEFAASKFHGTTYMDFKGDISGAISFCNHLLGMF